MAVLSSPLQLISSIPIVTRVFTATTLLTSLFYLWLRWQTGDPHCAPYLTLIPGASYLYPWTLVTSMFVETNVIELLVTLIVIPPSLRYLERLWGAAETAKFIVATVGVSNIIAFGLNWLEFIVLRNADLFLYGMQYHGQMALQIGVLIAFTQLIPEHQVQVFGILKARVKTLPMAYVTFSTVMSIIGFQCPYIVIQFGFLVSWIWLRFYKKNIGEGMVGGDSYGDRSETFALYHWFPPFLRTPITMLGDLVFKYATQFHLIPASSGDIEANGYAAVPGGARAEAERRRAMALKALDQRLANSSSAPNGSSQPSAAAGQAAAPPLPSSPPKVTTESDEPVGDVDIGSGKGKAREDSIR